MKVAVTLGGNALLQRGHRHASALLDGTAGTTVVRATC